MTEVLHHISCLFKELNSNTFAGLAGFFVKGTCSHPSGTATFWKKPKTSIHQLKNFHTTKQNIQLKMRPVFIFVAYCFLGTSYYAVLPSEQPSECNNRIRAKNELCQFQSDIPQRWIHNFLQSISQKCCLVISSGPAWLNTIF